MCSLATSRPENVVQKAQYFLAEGEDFIKAPELQREKKWSVAE